MFRYFDIGNFKLYRPDFIYCSKILHVLLADGQPKEKRFTEQQVSSVEGSYKDMLLCNPEFDATFALEMVDRDVTCWGYR